MSKKFAKKSMFLLLAGMLAACETTGKTQNVVFKENTSRAVKQADYDSCKIASLKDIPQIMKSNISGGYSSPGSIQCSTFGNNTNCRQMGGVDISPKISTQDVNEGLRERYIDKCLKSKGYSIISIPICPTAEGRDMARKASIEGTSTLEKNKCSSGDVLEE